MSSWMEIVVSVCVVALAVVLIPAVIAGRRSLQRAETLLVALERELGPLATQVLGLTEDLRTVVRQANRELERLGGAAERVGDLPERVAGPVGALGTGTLAGPGVRA